MSEPDKASEAEETKGMPILIGLTIFQRITKRRMAGAPRVEDRKGIRISSAV